MNGARQRRDRVASAQANDPIDHHWVCTSIAWLNLAEQDPFVAVGQQGKEAVVRRIDTGAEHRALLVGSGHVIGDRRVTPSLEERECRARRLWRRVRRADLGVWDAGCIQTNDAPRQSQLCAKPAFDAQHALRARRRRKRIDIHDLVRRAEAPYTSDALLEAGWVPRQIDVHDHRRPLEVETFAENIGRDEKRDPVGSAGLGVRQARRELRQHSAAL